MSRPPIRNVTSNSNNIKEKTVAVGRGGTRFEDLSDKETLHQFVRENRQIVEAQSQEIDLVSQAAQAKKRGELDVSLNEPIRKPPNKIKPQQPPSLQEQRAFLKQKQLEALHNENEHYEEEANDEEEITTIHDIITSDSNEPDWMDKEAKIILNTLPGVKTLTTEQQKVILDRIPLNQKNAILKNEGYTEKNKEANKSIPTKITNIDDDGLIDPPPISVSKMRKLIEQEIAEKAEKGEQLLPKEKTAPRFVIKSIEARDEDYQPFNPISGCVFYDFDQIFIRKFNIADADNLHKSKVEADLVAFVHAVGATLKIEGASILDLSVPDLRNLLYWHQFNSFNKTPMHVEWTSKYGNKNYYRITDRTLTYKAPVISKEKYQAEWKIKGLTVPTVRDWLFYQTEELTVEEEFLFDKAQWFIGDKNDASFQSKIDSMTAFCSRDLDAYSAIPEFRDIAAHGILETIDVIDAKFDPAQYLQVLKKELDILYKERKDLEDNDQLDFAENEFSDDRIVELNEQIMDIEDRMERKEVVEADVETRPINMSILEFFPRI